MPWQSGQRPTGNGWDRRRQIDHNFPTTTQESEKRAERIGQIRRRQPPMPFDVVADEVQHEPRTQCVQVNRAVAIYSVKEPLNRQAAFELW